jgi:hypothetical protein
MAKARAIAVKEQVLDRAARHQRDTVNAAFEIGALLEQAHEACEHGEFLDWIEREFGWSYRTALRYRSIYALAEKCQCGTFDDLRISLTALYVAADQDDPRAAQAILDAAKTRPVTARIAREIAEQQRTPEPPVVSAHDDAPSIEPRDGPMPEDDVTDGDEPGPSPRTRGLLARTLSALQRDHGDDDWRRAVAEIGGVDQLRGVIAKLELIHSRLCDKDAIAAMADAAEARSKMKLH